MIIMLLRITRKILEQNNCGETMNEDGVNGITSFERRDQRRATRHRLRDNKARLFIFYFFVLKY